MKKPENPELIKAIRFLRSKSKELDAPVWRDLAERLERSKHKRDIVNLSRINRYIEDGETAAVPGKVLGAGTLDRKISVAAFNFSEEAKRKIEASGGECLTFSALIEENPNGANLRIIG